MSIGMQTLDLRRRRCWCRQVLCLVVQGFCCLWQIARLRMMYRCVRIKIVRRRRSRCQRWWRPISLASSVTSCDRWNRKGSIWWTRNHICATLVERWVGLRHEPGCGRSVLLQCSRRTRQPAVWWRRDLNVSDMMLLLLFLRIVHGSRNRRSGKFLR